MAGPRFSTVRHDDYTVVTVTGELGVVSEADLDGHLAEAGEPGRRLIVDLSELTFIDTAALGVLVRHARRLGEEGGRLVLAGARYSAARTLWSSGLAGRLTVAGDLDEALSLPPPGP